MSEHYYVGDAALAAPQIVLGTDERVLWSGRCAVAEYAFDEPASLPRWTLPEETEVVISDQRVLYLGPGAADTGELRWSWPQHLRVQPGSRETGRQATVTQIQLVCAGPGGSFPALVFAGGDLTTVRDADRVANLLRQAIARHRVEHATELGIAPQQVRMLSRLVIGPEFNNFQGGEGQTVSLIGAVSVEAHATPAHAVAAQSSPEAARFSDPRAPVTHASVESAAPGYAPVAPVVAPQSPVATSAAAGLPSAWGGVTPSAASTRDNSSRVAAGPAREGSSPPVSAPSTIPSAWRTSSARDVRSARETSSPVTTRPSSPEKSAPATPAAASAWEDTAPLTRDGSPAAWDSSSAAVIAAWNSATPAAPSGWNSAEPAAPSGSDAAAPSGSDTAAPSGRDAAAPSGSGAVAPSGSEADGRSYERTARIPVTPQRESWSARPAEASALRGHPDLDARASELAARVASLVSGGDAPLGGRPLAASENQTNLSAYLDVPPPAALQPRPAADDTTDEASGRAESVRRTAARFAGNAARGRGSAPRHDGEVGSSGRGSHRQG